MSQISLSHQFSRRWSVAPQPIKDALVQELDDIVRLLDNSTALEAFKFAIPDLDDYIEAVYADLARQKALETPAPKTAMLPETTDNEPQQTAKPALGHLAQQDTPCELGAQNDNDIVAKGSNIAATSGDTPAHTSTGTTSGSTTLVPAITATNASNATDLKAAALAITPKEVSSSVIIEALDANHTHNKEAILSEQTVDTLKTLAEQHVNKVSHSAATAAPKAIIDDTLLKELEANIDDYLTERLTDISEDLKSWLREQVKQHNQQAADDHS